MDIGTAAALLYMDGKRERETHNLEGLRTDYNNLANRYNNLLRSNADLREERSDLIKNVNVKADIIKESNAELTEAYQERNALRTEVVNLKKEVASQQGLSDEVVALKNEIANLKAFVQKQNDYVQDASAKNKNLLEIATNQCKEIQDLTSQNSYLKDQLVTIGHELDQRKYVLEAIRRVMKDIPVELRIKAMAAAYVKYPDVSQASQNEDMPDNMKKDIEMLMVMAVLTETGPERTKVMALYDEKKIEVAKEMAASKKGYEKADGKLNTSIKEAKDLGKVSKEIPDILTTLAEMTNNAKAEENVSTQENTEAGTLRPR